MALVNLNRMLVGGVLVTGMAACGDRDLSFGDHPDVIWWTDHETADVSGWTGNPRPGGFILPGNSRVEVVKGIARSGDYALLIQDNSPDARDFPLAARSGPLPNEVYCSAWYYLPELVQPKNIGGTFCFVAAVPPTISIRFVTRSGSFLRRVTMGPWAPASRVLIWRIGTAPR